MTAPNQYRCETCQHYIGDSKERYGVCNIDNHQVTKTIYLICESRGCASHSSAPVNQQPLQGLPVCPKCGSATFWNNTDDIQTFFCINDKCKWKQQIRSHPYNPQFPVPNDEQCRICSQAERENVLDEVETIVANLVPLSYYYEVSAKIKELRQDESFGIVKKDSKNFNKGQITGGYKKPRNGKEQK